MDARVRAKANRKTAYCAHHETARIAPDSNRSSAHYSDLTRTLRGGVRAALLRAPTAVQTWPETGMTITLDELRSFVRLCDPQRPLEANDPLYVPFDEGEPTRGSTHASCIHALNRFI